LRKSNQHKLPRPLRGFDHINRYWDGRMELPAAKILPGECYVSDKGEMISTVLGSCVAACVRDKKIGIGGMNHFMLPVQRSTSAIDRPSLNNSALCYGNWAMEFLINEIMKRGGNKSDLEIKVFGGGAVLSAMDKINVGERNITFIFEFLQRENLLVKSHDVGNDYPRKVLYFPDTGSVKMKKLTTRVNDTVEKRERKYLDSMVEQPSTCDVELF